MSIFNDNDELEKLITESVEGLTPGQVREVRLFARDLIGLTVDECGAVAQKAVTAIHAIRKTSKSS